jgi:hypothetical protein
MPTAGIQISDLSLELHYRGGRFTIDPSAILLFSTCPSLAPEHQQRIVANRLWFCFGSGKV